MAFVRRKIELTFILGIGNFGTQGEETITVGADVDTATLAGLRVRAHIKYVGDITLGEAQLEVYGLTRSLLNQLSGIAQYAMVLRRNRVIISAGDEIEGMAIVFEGTINQAWADYNGADAVLHVMATAGAFFLAQPTDPRSYPGTADVATVVENIAHAMGYSVENNGVSVILSTPYFYGTLVDQLRDAAAAANIEAVIIDSERTIVIVPKGKARGGDIPLVAPETGMVGYPIHDATGVIVTMLFSRLIRIFGKVQLRSSLPAAIGEWLVIAVTHDLESETQGGEWYTHFQATTLDNPHAQPTIK